MPLRRDVAIVGGGVVGLVTALALARLSSQRILLIDAGGLSGTFCPAASGGRVSALSPASQRIFERLGVWQGIAEKEISPFLHMHVWCAEGQGRVDFSASSAKVPALGYIVANRLLESELLSALRQCPEVELLPHVSPAALAFSESGVTIQTAEGTDYTARLVIGADGAHSSMRELAGLPLEIKDYGQTALVATVKTTLPHAQTAWQCFLPTGPLAFLPLASPDTCSIVWSTTPEEAIRLQALTDSEFADALREAFQGRLGEVSEVTGRQAFPLVRRLASAWVRDGFALVGDAAHTIHPLAGQGMNLGLLDAATLAETVAGAAKAGRDFGGRHTLRGYERARKTGSLTMLAAMDFFRYVSGRQESAVQWLWQGGMTCVNQWTLLKRCLTDYALGKLGELPRLACASGK